MKEPSVLDYVKARLMPWRGPAPQLPAVEPEAAAVAETVSAEAAGAVSVRSETAAAEPAEAEPPGAENGSGYGPSVASRRPEEAAAPAVSTMTDRAVPLARSLPWRSLLALALAFLAQRSLEPAPDRSWLPGAVLYLFAFIWLAAAVWAGEWKDRGDEGRRTKDEGEEPIRIHPSSSDLRPL